MLSDEPRAFTLAGRFEPESGCVGGVFVVAGANIRSDAGTVVAAAAIGVRDEEAGRVAFLKVIEGKG